MGEFDLIHRFFKRPPRQAVVGVGDDCAVWSPRPGHQLLFSADMLVEGRHFLSTVDPFRLGHKALAVNLSDLAACGAQPQAFLLSLSMPRADEPWLSGFSQGLFALADHFGCELMGGDTTQGPLTIAITVMGDVPNGQAVLRNGAQVGDDLYVSGFLGDAALALEAFRGTIQLPQDVFEMARLRMETPTPRVELGMALRSIATAMADISDGLVGDLGHILQASHVGAEISLPPVTSLMQSACLWSCPADLANRCTLSGGDDYELVFSAPPSMSAAVHAAALACGVRVTRIGQITHNSGTLSLRDASGQLKPCELRSFDHFA
jgi:thiamine-monophosphate kinase